MYILAFGYLVLLGISEFGNYLGFGHSGTIMGCERSKFELLICKKDEEEFSIRNRGSVRGSKNT